MRDALVDWQVWWTDFWLDHPVIFCALLLAIGSVAYVVHRRK
jgi:hypothetical protein